MAKIKRIIFFGSPEFAVPTLEALVDAGRSPAMVVTQPARPVGRGRKPAEPPVAQWAREHGLKVVQPAKVSADDFLETVRELAPDLGVVAAYGQIFPAELLELPTHGCINVHASLLPKYRGASPIQAVIRDGNSTTGVTIMQMEEELDAGPILLVGKLAIGPRESAGALTDRLAQLGGELLLTAVEELEKGSLESRTQRDGDATYAGRLRREHGKLDWNLPAGDIYNRLRAYTPWPGLYALFRGKEVKILHASAIEWEMAPFGTSGTYLGMRQGRLAVLCGESTILGIESLQRPGRSPVRSAEFLNGERLQVGEHFV